MNAIRWRIQYAFWYLGWRVNLALADQRSVHGIRIRAQSRVDKAQNQRALDLAEAALNLIAEFDPRRLRRIARDIAGIWVVRTGYAIAHFSPGTKMCVIDREYLAKPGRTAGQVAATIVHEGMHARLEARHVPYTEPLRPRVEALCSAQEADFARKLPEGDALALQILQSLPTDPQHWSTERLQRRRWEGRQVEHEAELQELEAAELPGWIARWLRRLVQSRAERDARRAATK